MKTRLIALATGVMLSLLGASAAGAFEFKPYDATAQAAIDSGKPVIVHVYAPWCLQCRAQEAILGKLGSDASYDGISFYRVDYDKQKDAVKGFDVPRSTLIAFNGGAEVAKMSWGTSTESVLGVLDAAK